MKFLDKLRTKFTKRQSDVTTPLATLVKTDAPQPTSFLGRIRQRITVWVTANKNLAAILGVLLALLLSGGVYAALSSSARNTHTGDVATTMDDAQAGDSPTAPSGQSSANNPGSASTDKSSSTSSTPQSTTAPSAIAGPIGFVGCSNIRDTVQGYITDGGSKIWVPVDNTYAGGTVKKWSDLSSEYWTQFNQFLAAHPTTKTIWWGLCTYASDRESDADNNKAAPVVLDELRKKIPGVTVYVSAINSFVAPHVCRLTGDDGPSRMQTLANSLVSNQGLKAGPAVGSLISFYQTPSAGATAANNQTKDDGCHPNDAGEVYLGKALLAFFGS